MSKYFMMDAAVALEAVDGSAAVSTNMIYPDWVGYSNTLYANKWFTLFPSTDARSSLSWSNRLANFRNTEVYNFYSSGEDVLRAYAGTPPPDLFSSVPETIKGVLAGSAGIYAWAWQEKGKGRAAFDDFLASAHGGWRFNRFYDQPVGTRMPPSQANVLPGSQLRTNAFFDFGSLDFFYPDLNLYGANGSQYAAANRNRILADPIPALTLPVGANPVPRLSPQFGENRNFNMPDEFKNGWPSTRISEEQQKWHHSDFKDVAYTFVYRLFDEFVNQGDLD
jgi:hypothetical protein